MVSSWTFCHLVDPLATLELWANALRVGGRLYANDVDFSVLFAGEAEGWELEPEARMHRAFAALHKEGPAEEAFAVDFAFDAAEYRTT